MNASPPFIFGGLPPQLCDPQTAEIAILPVPYDATSTWKKGADRGPAAIIEASTQVELYDIPTATDVSRRGICTLPAVECTGPPETMVDLVERAFRDIVRRRQFPVILGGEHSVSIGPIRAAAELFAECSVLQIDAHTDTRETYEGSRFNHACVMARAREWCPITQVGIRSMDAEEVDGLDRDRLFLANEVAGSHDRSWMDRAVEQQRENVYVTIDLDGFDPALVPATGTPEPGGLSWSEVNDLLARLCARRNVVAFDVVELLPHPAHWSSDFLAAKLVYRFLSMVFASRA